MNKIGGKTKSSRASNKKYIVITLSQKFYALSYVANSNIFPDQIKIEERRFESILKSLERSGLVKFDSSFLFIENFWESVNERVFITRKGRYFLELFSSKVNKSKIFNFFILGDAGFKRDEKNFYKVWFTEVFSTNETRYLNNAMKKWRNE